MSENAGYVHISPEKLVEVCDMCLDIFNNYKGEDDELKSYEYFSWRKLRKVKKEYSNQPTYTYWNAGIKTRLLALKEIGKNVIDDREVVDRDIKLSLTTHTNLYKMLNRDKTFQPFIFGLGY